MKITFLGIFAPFKYSQIVKNIVFRFNFKYCSDIQLSCPKASICLKYTQQCLSAINGKPKLRTKQQPKIVKSAPILTPRIKKEFGGKNCSRTKHVLIHDHPQQIFQNSDLLLKFRIIVCFKNHQIYRSSVISHRGLESSFDETMVEILLYYFDVTRLSLR